MREEIENWWKQAHSDFRKAEVLYDTENFDGAVFYFHQSVEKALKAISLIKLREIPKGHSLRYLATRVGVPDKMISGINDLNSEYLACRYPDAACGVPSELYDRQIADRHRRTAEEVLKWAENLTKE
jgi:HEPN domain-containing protein